MPTINPQAFHRDGYYPVGLQHPDIDMEKPVVRQTLSSDTGTSTQLHGDYSATAPLVPSTSYPPLPRNQTQKSDETMHPNYDPEHAAGPYGSHSSRNSSWDVFSGIKSSIVNTKNMIQRMQPRATLPLPMAIFRTIKSVTLVHIIRKSQHVVVRPYGYIIIS